MGVHSAPFCVCIILKDGGRSARVRREAITNFSKVYLFYFFNLEDSEKGATPRQFALSAQQVVRNDKNTVHYALPLNL